MPHPGVLGVGEPVRQPLGLEQVEAILAEIQRLAASEIAKRKVVDPGEVAKVCNSLQVAILLVVIVQVERSPQTGPPVPDDDDVGRGDHQEDARAAAATDGVLKRKEETNCYFLCDLRSTRFKIGALHCSSLHSTLLYSTFESNFRVQVLSPISESNFQVQFSNF